MKNLYLYHGTSDKVVTPFFGGGDDKHDKGQNLLGYTLMMVRNNIKLRAESGENRRYL